MITLIHYLHALLAWLQARLGHDAPTTYFVHGDHWLRTEHVHVAPLRVEHRVNGQRVYHGKDLESIARDAGVPIGHWRATIIFDRE